jgi:hypothetical protein
VFGPNQSAQIATTAFIIGGEFLEPKIMLKKR